MKKRPDLMVLKTIRKRPRPKVKKLPESKSVKYMNSFKNREPKSMQGSITFTEWIEEIESSMKNENLWPTDLEEWTPMHVAEFLHRLQDQFWKRVPLPFEKVLELSFSAKMDYLEHTRTPTFFQRQVFNFIYRKIRRWFWDAGICRLHFWKPCVTPVFTAAQIKNPHEYFGFSYIPIRFGLPLTAPK
ncbi:MAG: hypothetical protein V4576_01635 [Patescibacteria group bacterium]